ncbi:hypothetical protein AHAS_Ahas19G0131200 [Arachis hypogaea]
MHQGQNNQRWTEPQGSEGQQREKRKSQGHHQEEKELCSTPPSPPIHSHHREGSVAIIPVPSFVPFIATAVITGVSVAVDTAIGVARNQFLELLLMILMLLRRLRAAMLLPEEGNS